MSQASHNHPQPSSEGATPEPTTTEGQARLDGRYRFCAGRPVNPDEGVHPEMRTDTAASNSGRLADSEAIPSSPAELIAMQDKSNHPRPEKPNRQTSRQPGSSDAGPRVASGRVQFPAAEYGSCSRRCRRRWID